MAARFERIEPGERGQLHVEAKNSISIDHFQPLDNGLMAAEALGAICAWSKGRGGLRLLLCWTSMIVNRALVIRIAILLLDGTVRGPLIVAAPLLFGLPATLTIGSAALRLRRAGATRACQRCDCDLPQVNMLVCPECDKPATGATL